jgi:hypothetical protein
MKIGPAVVLLAFMIVAFATLAVHGGGRRLAEPALPIVLLLLVIAMLRRLRVGG